MSASSASRPIDVVVIGDGPAASALAHACRSRDFDCALVGPDEPWTATYATWLDDVRDVLGERRVVDLLATSTPSVRAYTGRTHDLSREYGVFDNDALRHYLRADVEHCEGRVAAVTTCADKRTQRVALLDGTVITARVVVDAAGWPARFAGNRGATAPAWQTAFGVVLPEPPSGELGRATLMDFRPIASRRSDAAPSTIGPDGVVTFCYSIPVADGWLVEETVLASRRSIEPIALLPRLAARLGRHPDALLASAIRTEYVRIPMGAPVVRGVRSVVAFGAAAGYVHPATGFSVAASLRAALRVAAAIERDLAGHPGRSAGNDTIADSIWPRSALRSRVLHQYGLDVLATLDGDEVRQFFGLFFDRPTAEWSEYLRLDATPTGVARTMARMFRSAPWSLRRRLLAANPSAFARLLRP